MVQWLKLPTPDAGGLVPQLRPGAANYIVFLQNTFFFFKFEVVDVKEMV